MNATDMEERLENIDRRLARVEQILPTLATKTDLERFATKADLERFATKTDLERFATKADLERFATKADLEDAKQLTRVLFESTRHDIKLIADGVALLTERLERKGVI